MRSITYVIARGVVDSCWAAGRRSSAKVDRTADTSVGAWGTFWILIAAMAIGASLCGPSGALFGLIFASLFLYVTLASRDGNSTRYNAILQEQRIRALQLADADSMSGHDFEHYIAKLYQLRGFDAHVTSGSNDFGVDVIAVRGEVRLAIQTKRYAGKVSRTAVSDAVTGMYHYGCNMAVVVTNSYFSQGAISLALSTGCQLVNRDELADWISEVQLTVSPTFSQVGAGDSWTLDQPVAPFAAPSTASLPTCSEPVASQVPEAIREQIRNFAASEYPNDFLMQLDTMEEQTNSYLELQAIIAGLADGPELQPILSHCYEEYPGDFCMQLDTLKEALDAWEQLRALDPSAMPAGVLDMMLAAASEEYPSDYQMQLDTVNEQLEAYRRLQSV